MTLLRITDRGLYCAAGDFFIDPWAAVDRAVVTHAHGDHVAWGCRRYLTSAEGHAVLASRLDSGAEIESVGYGMALDLAGGAAHPRLSILLVRGNHDRRAGDPPGELGIDCVDAPAADPPFVLQHHPSESDGGYTLAGHLHPGLALAGPARFRERLPCFVIGLRRAILPAFGGFTGCHPVEPAFDEQLYVVAGHEVLAMGAGLVRRAGL